MPAPKQVPGELFPPPPEPPALAVPGVLSSAPVPPPADVIVEKIELFPFEPSDGFAPGPPAPPPPTVIG